MDSYFKHLSSLQYATQGAYRQEGKADSKQVFKKKDLMSVMKVEHCVVETEKEAHLSHWSGRPFGGNEVYPSTQRISFGGGKWVEGKHVEKGWKH